MKKPKIWSEDALAFFKEIYASTSNAELSVLLGISVSSIKKKAAEMHLSKKTAYKLTEEIQKAILEKYNTHSYQSIAKELSISRRTVCRFIKEQKTKGLRPRDREVDIKIMSAYRIRQYKSERARALFGIEQNTQYKIFPNKKKYWIRQKLHKYNYLVNRNGVDVIITPYTDRHAKFEASARKNGFHFTEMLSEEQFIILSINYPNIMKTTTEEDMMPADEQSFPMSIVSANGPAEEQIAAEYKL